MKCRPLTDREGGRDIVRVNNDKVIVELIFLLFYMKSIVELID